jgi:hypothetical protein
MLTLAYRYQIVYQSPTLLLFLAFSLKKMKRNGSGNSNVTGRKYMLLYIKESLMPQLKKFKIPFQLLQESSDLIESEKKNSN